MNSWRWLVCAFLFVAVLGSATLVQGGGQDKPAQGGKKDEGKKDEGKKDEGKKDEGKKDEGKKDEGKKDEGKKDQGKPEQKGEKLEWKAFEKGKSFYQEMTTKTDQKMKVQGQPIDQTQNQTFWVKWETKDVTDKTYVVEQTILGVKMDIEIGGNKINYDSNAKEGTQPNNPLTDFFKALVGAKFTLTIEKEDFKVSKIDGRAEFIAKLSKANPQLQPLLDAILSEDALKQMADPTFAVIPKGGVVPASGKWDKDVKLNMGPIGTYTTKYTYTLDGAPKDGLAQIKVDATLNYEAPKGGDKGQGLPFKIGSGSTLKSETSKGLIVFDTAKGRVKSSDLTLKLVGDLNIEIGGMTTEVHLDQTQVTTLTTSDTEPAALTANKK